ncbi:hypothetical protein L3V82_08615 [Thiotrichales bacterium 19S3-7]|nr:hypothetical protein [Thiotrichales bacterium 19S3-7]MCF6802219.1 hypothetical protein [Thiotrichales bacterium 19S3-11]
MICRTVRGHFKERQQKKPANVLKSDTLYPWHMMDQTIKSDKQYHKVPSLTG